MPINNDGTINDAYKAPSQKVDQNSETGTKVVVEGVPNDYLGKDAFLQLMITQLRYQDPLDPMDNKDSIAQMAQFSALEQMQNLNTNMQLSQSGIKFAIDDLNTNLTEIKKALDAYGIKVPEVPKKPVVTEGENGEKITTHPDGTIVTEKDGTVVTKKPDGTTITKKPDGTVITKDKDGNETTEPPKK